MDATMTEGLRSPHRWARLLGWTTLAGLIFGVIGPYGSFIANPINRFCFWMSVFWAGTILLWPTMTIAIRWAERKSLPVLLIGGVTMLLACMPLAAFARASCSVLWPVHASGITAQEWYVLTLVVAAPATVIAMWLDRLLLGTRAPAEQRTDGPSGLERLPERMLDQVICIQMEDHHIRAHIRGGSRLYYGSMRDAVSQLGPRGIQVHRSWWVAHGTVAGFDEVDRAFFLKLKNGVTIPVARSRVAAVRAIGWLAPEPDAAEHRQ